MANLGPDLVGARGGAKPSPKTVESEATLSGFLPWKQVRS